MVQPLPVRLQETPSQTAGPYVHIGLIPHQAGFDIFEKNFSNVLTGPDTEGERIRIEGRVFDGAGSLVRDAFIESLAEAVRSSLDRSGGVAPYGPWRCPAGHAKCALKAEGVLI